MRLNILHEFLGMRIFCSMCVSSLRAVDKKQHVDDSDRCLFKRIKKDFFIRYVTMDETLIHRFSTESNWRSAEWTAQNKSQPKRPKTLQSAGKVMRSLIWDAHEIRFIDCFKKGITIHNECYIAFLVRLKEKKRENANK